MKISDEFVNPSLNLLTVDRYFIRKSIFDSLTDNLKQLTGILLDVGCGDMPYKNYIQENSDVKFYIGIDIYTELYGNADLLWDGKKMPINNNKIDSIILTEVLEHCPNPELFLKELFRILKPGGFIFLTVPFIWNLHIVPNDEYRYTPFALNRLLNNAKFTKVKITPHSGWDVSLAQMLGLWARRRFTYTNYKKYFIATLVLPFIYFLKFIDRKPKEFNEGAMFIGLSATAIKDE